MSFSSASPASPSLSGVPRRRFLTTAGAFGLTLPLSLAARETGAGPLRFGVISDVHQDFMHDAVERMGRFVEAMGKARPDFIVQLGDFCVPDERNRPFLDVWNRFPGPRRHVLGNHDTDGGHKPGQTMEFWGMPARHYAFDAGPIRFIVLDGNEAGGKKPGYKRFISPAQADWLKRELDGAESPVIILIHQPLDNNAGVENHAEIRALLEKPRADGRPGVIACFSGHLHQDYVRRINGVIHAQINSASYYWLGNKELAREVYPAELHEKHPLLRRVAPYREPLWALVTVDLNQGKMTIEGRRSEFVGPDPWQRGATEKECPPDRVRAAISDWSGETGA